MPQTYKRPPIIEAAIEVRFKDPVTMLVVDRLRDRLLPRFPACETVTEFAFDISALSTGPTQVQSNVHSYRMTSSTGTEIVVIGAQTALFSRLAPYPGWDSFRDEARKLWNMHRKIAGVSGVSRIGMRYVNRLDVPANNQPGIQVEDYLRIYSEYPDWEIGKPSHFSCQMMAAEEGGPFGVVINTASTPSPVPGCLGLLVDIDVSRTQSVFHSERSLREVLEDMRTEKNRLFEIAITDKTRAILNDEGDI